LPDRYGVTAALMKAATLTAGGRRQNWTGLIGKFY
jgi:hypothetical protein